MDNVYKNFTSVNASEFLRAEIPPLGRMTPTEALTDPRFYLETVHLSSVTDSRKKASSNVQPFENLFLVSDVSFFVAIDERRPLCKTETRKSSF